MSKTLRRLFLLSFFSVFQLACSSWKSVEVLEAKKPPNVLIFLADDLTYQDTGVYGNRDVHTPHLDKFAREGLKFNYAFSSSPTCAPTRMALYSGVQPIRNGGHPNHGRSYDHIRSLPNYLRPLGYRVATVGKRHESPIDNFSFEHLGGYHHDHGAKKVKQDIELPLIETYFNETEQPWVLVAASNQPHTPWNRGDASRYNAKRITVPDYLIDTPETREAMTHYYGEITYMDQQFGEILSLLEASGEAENTVVLFLSEQGSNFPFAKWTLYDNGVRVGVLARWPGVIERNTQTDAIIQYVDIVPTLIDMAGGRLKGMDLDGQSIVPILKGEASEHRKFAFSTATTRGINQGSESYPIRSVRDHQYRLIWNLNYERHFMNTVVSRGGPEKTLRSWQASTEISDKERAAFYLKRPEFELYNLKKEHYERVNLAYNENYRVIKERLLKALVAWMESQGDEGLATEMDALNRKRKGKRKTPLGIPDAGKRLDWDYSKAENNP